MQERIGILGGTFNPIHIGHLILAQAAAEEFDLARVLFVPASIPPHKAPPTGATAAQRFSMVQLAIEDNPLFEASDLELNRAGASYTIDTIRTLHHGMPSAKLHFILGADSLLELHTWREIATLLEMCDFLPFQRPGRRPPLQPADLRLPTPWPERLAGNLRQGRMIDVSSSDIRYRVAEGLSIRYLVPPSVEMFIMEHNLYGR